MAISVMPDDGNAARPFRTRTVKVLVDGALKRWLPASGYWHFRAWRLGFFDPELRLLRYLCDKRKASVDVGASGGSYTVHLLIHSAECWAFEPRVRDAAYLAWRLTTRPDPRLHIETVAVSDRD